MFLRFCRSLGWPRKAMSTKVIPDLSAALTLASRRHVVTMVCQPLIYPGWFHLEVTPKQDVRLLFRSLMKQTKGVKKIWSWHERTRPGPKIVGKQWKTYDNYAVHPMFDQNVSHYLGCCMLFHARCTEVGKAGLKEHQMIHEARALLTKHLNCSLQGLGVGMPRCDGTRWVM